MSIPSCKNQEPRGPYVCCLDEDHKSEHKAFKHNAQGQLEVCARWPNLRVPKCSNCHVSGAELPLDTYEPTEAQQAAFAWVGRYVLVCIPCNKKLTLDWLRSPPPEAVEFPKFSTAWWKDETNHALVKRPAGIDSPIAMKVALENEIAETVKKIQEAHAHFVGDYSFGPGEIKVHAFDGIPRDTVYGVSTSFDIPKPPDEKRLAGLRVGVDFGGDDMTDALLYAMENTKPFMGLNREEHSVRLSQQPYQGPRRPALPGPQQTAKPRVSYRIYDNQWRDDVLIVAESNENHGWGRMVVVSGQAMACFKSRTNAPPGEVALTDDDLETIIEYMAHKGAMHFQPWTPAEDDDDDDLLEEYAHLRRELFMTDPELLAHVAKNLDLDLVNNRGLAASARLQDGLETAYVLAEDTTNKVEAAALHRATRRAGAVLNFREREEG